MSQCQAQTLHGQRCQNLALPNSWYCHVDSHKPHKIYLELSDDYRRGRHLRLIEPASQRIQAIEQGQDFEGIESATLDYHDNEPFIVWLMGYFDSILFRKVFQNLSDAQQFTKNVYYLVNERGPFIITGMTCAYHDEGYYQPMPSHPISLPELDEVNLDEIIYTITIDSRAKTIDAILICD